MNRRTFSQLLGAGSFGLVSASAQAGEQGTDAPRDEAAAADAPAPEPVNLEDFKLLAKAKLPKATFDYITTGSADEITLRENVAAFQRLKVLPPLLVGVGKVDLTTVVLKQKIALPVMLAPVAGQRMFHPQGALAAAKAAATAGTIFGASSSAFHSVEEIAAAGNGPKWFQLYSPKDRTVTRKLVERAERAGYQALIVTVDRGEWKDADRRNRFSIPKDILVKHLRDVGFEQITAQMDYPEIVAFNERAWDGALTWDYFDWLRSITKLPLLLKGVLRPEDARKAVALGLEGIVVSNHGGRALDGMPASIDVLPKIVEAVGGKIEVYMDSGIRRGTDVLKALALGARAVFIGRPYAWALAAAGEEGVRTILDLLRAELVNAMTATGCSKIGDVQRALIV